ncbi:hypothetical protein O7599_15915 [Streptomyces sp. WMMC500]|uniref:hypothetical protein n=1 Tax=Streptomyces sp. WMMC500 TaxID=3015154 RepID=UPI00248AC3C7|nr:hypothetical protein [Streptomyces sp. WMMC500]WBB63910.1 hypothetical protein O7599_15915 [Streptomyces sp. WMMC500]
MGLFRRKARRAGGTSAAHEVGILFDIDDLGGGSYGQAAYRILFAALDPQRLAGCSFHDGDTNSTIHGTQRLYCIAVRSSDPAQITYVRQTMARRTDEGLLTLDLRLTAGRITEREPLVPAGFVNDRAALVVPEHELIQKHWTEGSAWRVVFK